MGGYHRRRNHRRRLRRDVAFGEPSVSRRRLDAGVLTGIALTTTGPVLRTRSFRLLAHAVLGAFVLFAALLVTAFSAAAGALTLSFVNVVVLGSIWGLGVTLVLAGVLVFLEANQMLRRVATIGLAITVVWGLVVVILVGGVVAHLIAEGFDLAIVQDLRDDLVPFLVVSIAFVVLPVLVFHQDLKELRSHDATRR
ncbi:hypothetical protein SAMN04487948_11573 [Halogranum amylolyticum]|uniref:Uncharacterized protein n=1 Tax=Halogranum amylolyticum TaxID=660520 RepID=A0A1H8VBU3_9EURY|nr:hypothetical protein SAMN04487948_11573 [Halogranum amylolyticum]